MYGQTIALSRSSFYAESATGALFANSHSFIGKNYFAECASVNRARCQFNNRRAEFVYQLCIALGVDGVHVMAKSVTIDHMCT
jgi:hypothetical protein